MAKKCLWVAVFVALFSNGVFAQTYYAVADGNWSDASIWSLSQGGAGGAGIPGIGSTAYTDGYEIGVDQDVTLANLGIRSTNRVGVQLYFNGGFDPITITITGSLAGITATPPNQTPPTESVLEDTPLLVFRFTSIAGAGAIRNWSYVAPINTLEIAPSSGIVTIPLSAFLAVSDNLTIVSGSLFSRTNLADASGVANIIVNSGTTLNLNAGTVSVTGNGTLGTSFWAVQIYGTVNLGANNSLTTTNITVGSTGVLNVGFSGANQTQGWWYQNMSPVFSSLDPASVVNYTGNVTQNIGGAVTYGNLLLTSGSAVAKTLSGITLGILGNLTVQTPITSAASSLVTFSGTAPQTISGGGTLTFNGGLIVNKASSTLTFGQPLTIGGGVTVSALSTLNLGNFQTTVNSASWNNLGTTTSGTTGTLRVIGGTSTFFGAGSLTLNNLTTSASGTAVFNNSAWSITGDLTNNGTITLPSNATVSFTGASNSSISGNAFTIGNMVVNKNTALNNNGTVNLKGLLTMINGTFDADGAGLGVLRLISDATGDAAIGVITNGSIVGNVTFERYFANSIVNRWRNIAFPVTGVTHAALGTSLTLKTNSLAYYTEATPGNVEQGFSYVNSGTLPDGQGFSAWMYDSGPITISARGPLLKQGNSSYNYNVTYTNNVPGAPDADDGWNFVPNPYASPIDWNSGSGWVKTRVNAVASIWDEEGFAYRLTNAGYNIIAQGQGFWVQTFAGAGNPTLTSTGATKVINANPAFYRKAFDEETSKLLVNLKSDKYYDVAVVQFKKGASPGFDHEFDAYKMKNPIFNITTITNGGEKLASNVLPKSACTSNVKIDITNIEPGTYSLKFDGLSSFSDVNSISLVDHMTEKTLALGEGKDYSFEVTSDEKSYGSERFELVFDFADQITKPMIVKEDNRLISNYEDGNQWYLDETLIPGATGKRFTPTMRGAYTVAVQEDGCSLQSEPLIVNEGLSRIFPNPASEFLKVDVYGLLADGLSGNILLHSMRGQLVKDEKFTSRDNLIEIDIKELSPGPYVLTIVSDNGVIHEKSKVVIK